MTSALSVRKASTSCFTQVITNLLGNALKFTAEGGLTISLMVDRRQRDLAPDELSVTIAVTDTGIGIAPDKQATVFERFKQADGSTTRRYGGTGLGLAITKQLVEQMRGTMRLQSTVGEGSTFWVYLPLKRASRIDTTEQLGPWALLVTPPGNERRNYERMLARDFFCDFAANAREALKHLSIAARGGRPYDLVLVHEPTEGVIPVDFAQSVRTQALIARTPIILIAENGALADWEERLFAHVASKPVDGEAFLSTLMALRSSTGKADVNAAAGPPDGAADPPPQAAPQPRFEGTRVLLAEDDEVNQLFACGLLEELGCTWRLARDGAETLIAIRQEKFDIVLLDCLMPEMDGYTAAGHIRRMRDSREIDFVPVVAVTANAMPHDRRKCLAAGMDDYISKPMREADLVAVFERWLRSSQEGAREPEPAASRSAAPKLAIVPAGKQAQAVPSNAPAGAVSNPPAPNTAPGRAGQGAGVKALQQALRVAHEPPSAPASPAPQPAPARTAAPPVRTAAPPPQPAARAASLSPEMAERMAEAAALPVIDNKQFTATHKTMKGRFPLLVGMYATDAQRYVHDVVAGLSTGSLDAVIQPAHTLKASSRILGAARAGYWAAQLEYRAKEMSEGDAELTELAILAQAMSQALSETIREVKQRVASIEKAAG